MVHNKLSHFDEISLNYKTYYKAHNENGISDRILHLYKHIYI